MTGSSVRAGGALVAAALMLAACGTARTNASGGITVSAPADGATIKGNVVELAVSTDEIDIVKPDGDTSNTRGHWHVFIDREPLAPGSTMPKEPGIVHAAASPIRLTGLTVGEHRISVVLGNGSHRRIGDHVARRTVKLEGPSVDASAPVTLKAGATLSVDVKVEGVTLVAPDGNTSDKSGHLHVLVDRQPEPGKPMRKEAGVIHSVATTIPVPGLAAGEHTLWIVLGDGAHMPFAPAVMDSVTVVVG